MDYQINWEDEALDDLKQLVEYIAADNPDAARRMGMDVVNKVRQLASQPHLGRRYAPVEEDEIREVSVPPYRVFYRLEPGRVVVMAVWHGARAEPGF
jgi:plasmid stabilization system protein ParE